MEKSESIVNLAKAMSLLIAEKVDIEKNATNPHYRSKYADIYEVMSNLRPVLSKHGLTIIQSPSYDSGVVYLTTMLIHSSGEWIKDTCASPIPKNDIQGVASCVTYLRRMSTLSWLFLAGAEADDDGNSISTLTPTNPIKNVSTPIKPIQGTVPKPIAKATWTEKDKKDFEAAEAEYKKAWKESGLPISGLEKRSLDFYERRQDGENPKTLIMEVIEKTKTMKSRIAEKPTTKPATTDDIPF